MDAAELPVNGLQWDYEGDYEVYNVAGDQTLKTLVLDYDFLDNGYFELYIINDGTIELYHPDSGTVYEFKARGYIGYLKDGTTLGSRKRSKTKLPVMNVKRKRK